MSSDLLQQIQILQFSDRPAAEALVLAFTRDVFGFDVMSVELRPLAVSLNSFNGFLHLGDGTRLFFKTHTETDGVLGEYYNAAQLARAGYPVLQPLYSSTEAGKQLLIYEVIDSPSVFDLAWTIETGATEQLKALTDAQNAADDHLFQLYCQSIQWQTAEDAAKAPVHQLFYHRLTGGRLDRFYGHSTEIKLPGFHISMDAVRLAKWRINGQIYEDTLDRVIAQSVHLLSPPQAALSIVGHGDAHNGNVFFKEDGLVYFDPAFAGRHNPLLDLTKPLFHNVFALWMYFPQVKNEQMHIELQIRDNVWMVEYEYLLPPVRHMFLQSKVERVLIPILRELQQRQQLRQDWRAYLKSALFCCPFLTMNLTDSAKFPPQISLLGIAMAIEMGSESKGKRSLIDTTLDEVAEALVSR